MKKFCVKIGVVIFLMAAVVFAVAGCSSEETAPPKNVNYEFVWLDDFVDEIGKNPGKAKEKYLGEYVQFVAMRDTVMGNGSYFFMKSPIYNLKSMMLRFNVANKDVANSLKNSNKGSICRVLGKVTKIDVISEVTVYKMYENLSAKPSNHKLEYKRYMDNELFGDLQRNIYAAKDKYFLQNIMFVGFPENINSSFHIDSIFSQDCKIECIVNDDRVLRAVRRAVPGNAYTIKGMIVQVGPAQFPTRYTMELHDIYEYRGEEANP